MTTTAGSTGSDTGTGGIEGFDPLDTTAPRVHDGLARLRADGFVVHRFAHRRPIPSSMVRIRSMTSSAPPPIESSRTSR